MHPDDDQQPGAASDDPPPWPAVPAPPERRRPGRRWALLVAAVVAGGAAAGAFLVLGDRGPDHPDEWDPRVADLVTYTEQERNLTFLHPVHVDFLTPEEFESEVTSDPESLTTEEREDLERYEALFRGLGLLDADVDLLEVANATSGDGVLAYYDPEDDRIRVKGTELTVNVRGTLVHELVHVLQDQHFDLSRIGEYDTDARNATLRAVVEGDANRVEAAWADTLDPSDAEAYAGTVDEQRDNLLDDDAIPPVVLAFFAAPYALGEAFVEVLVEEGGLERLNRAIEDPPASEEHLLDPWTYLDDDQPATVAVPDLEDGEELIEDGDFGALTWFLVLAERIDAHDALQAVDGWGGDAYASFERGGRACTRAVFRGDEGDDTDEMEQALRQWASEMPGGDAMVERDGDSVGVEACDPGAAATAGTGAGLDAVSLPVVRTYLTLGAARSGGEVDLARCFGRELLADLSLAEVADPEGAAFTDPAIAGRATAAVGRCR